MTTMKRVAIVFALIGAHVALGADDDPQKASGQRYLEKLALLMKDRAPTQVIIGVYHGRKWRTEVRLEISRAPVESGGFLQLTVHSQRQLGEHRIEETGLHLLGYAWQPIRFEDTKTLDGVQRSRAVATLDGNRWKGRITSDGVVEEQEGVVALGACWCPVYLPWLMTPSEDMVLTELGPDARTVEVSCTGGRHRGRVGEGRIEWRMDHMRRDGSDFQLMIGMDGSVREIRSFQKAVIRSRRISQDEVGKDLEGPLDLTESQDVVTRLLEAVHSQDKDTIEQLLDFEAMFAGDIKGWEILSKEGRQEYLEEYKRGALETLLRAGKEMRTDILPISEIVEEGSLSVEEGDSADVWLGQLRFSLARREAPSGGVGWVVVKMVTEPDDK